MASPISRRQLLAGSAAALGAGALASCAKSGGDGDSSSSPPNIVVIVTDDQRWNALGCAGNNIIETPSLDALAGYGTRFANAFVTTSICCTSRASILTGQYARRHGVHEFHQQLTAPQFARTYPAALRSAGYWTGFVGKYGIGLDNLPVEGFDYWAGFPGQGSYFEPNSPNRTHLTARLGDRSLEFLDSVPNNAPFCLSISTKAAHAVDYDPDPFQYDPRFEEYYKGREIPLPPLANEQDFQRLPLFLRNTEGRKRWENRFSSPERFQESLRNYYRLITGVDDMVGRVLRELERREVLDNTVVIFTSDNGFMLGDRGLAGKWYAYEESMRVPLLITDFRRNAGARPGQVRREMALNIDIAPTIADLAGVTPGGRMDGLSLVPILQGESEAWRYTFFYEHLFNHPAIPRSEAVRTERWKYIRWIDRQPLYEQLFDLQNDPHERENLAGSQRAAAQLAELRSQWRTWRESLGDPA